MNIEFFAIVGMIPFGMMMGLAIYLFENKQKGE